MSYLVTTQESEPFITYWFEPENNFNPEVGMIVYDLVNLVYTNDGLEWIPFNIDTL